MSESKQAQTGDRRAIQVAERHAEGVASKSELASVSRSLLTGTAGRMVTRSSAIVSAKDSAAFASRFIHGHPATARTEKAKEVAQQARLLRDILGNPFRPVTVDPTWLTSTVVALAQQMYESRDFSAMPILADALQDAGCDKENILNHCRTEGAHVRGCWVVDLVLGKE